MPGIVPIAAPALFFDSFALAIGGLIYDWDVLARFVMPGESLPIRIIPKGNFNCYGWHCFGGDIVTINQLEKIYVAPTTPGLYPLVITQLNNDNAQSQNPLVKKINIFVMVPFQNLVKGKLNGYPIGWYPKSSPHPKLSSPRGFIEVTSAELESTNLSPNFILKDFICRQPGNYPKYLVLKEELIMKLELLLAKIREKGYPCSKLFIFSGYRTPRYNIGGGGGRHSAHIYGGAADLFIDEDGDSVIDDLNHDGRHNAFDSKILYDIMEELDQERPDLIGGLGWYRRVSGIGPCIHIDIRGKPTRWRQ